MNSIKKNFAYNAAYQVLVFIIPLITTPYISRILGATGIGVYSYSYSIAQYYVLFIMLGLNNYGNRTIAGVRDDRDALSKTFWSIYAMQIGLGIVVICIYAVYAFVLAKDRTAATIMLLYVLSACFDINWFFFGLERFKATVIRNSAIKILTAVSIFLFVKQPSDVYIYCTIMVVGMLVSQLVLWPYVKTNTYFYRPKWDEIKIHIKPNTVLFLTVIAVSLFKIMDKIMLGMMADTEQVGFYESSERIISIPTAFVTALGTVMLPRMSNLKAKSDKGSSELFFKSILFAMFLSSSMSFGIMAVAPVFVPLFYGKGFEICITLFLILLPSCLFFAFGNVIRTQYLLPQQLDRIYVISAFLGAAVNIIINALLIPHMGSVGAAIGTLVAEAVVCVYQAYKIRHDVNIKGFVINSLPFIVASIVMFVTIYNLRLSISNSIIELFTRVLLGALIYCIVVFGQYILINKVFKRGWMKDIIKH